MESSKEKILLATLKLASEQGLGNISLSKIAEKVGIRKASLYSHFESKEEIICQLYEFLRERTKRETNINIDYGAIVKGKTAIEVLNVAVKNYIKINSSPNMRIFYKFVMSERCVNPEAAKIIVMETEKMLLTTKQLFYAMQIHGLISIKNIDLAATTFAFTINGLLNYQDDKLLAEKTKIGKMIDEFIENFCDVYGK